MKIAIVTTHIENKEIQLGISNTVYLIAKELAKKPDIELTIYAIKGKRQEKTETLFNKVTVKRFPFTRILTDWTVSLPMLKQLLKDKPDLIHGFYYGYYPSFAGYIASRMLKVPYMLTPSYHDNYGTAKKRALMRMFNTIIGKRMFKDANKVFPQNRDEEKKISKMINS